MADQRLYNARVTTEALEKKFRDTFPSQAGAELVDDLYASGVITPIVDFTAAAQGSELPQLLQTALDFSTLVTTRTTNGTSVITTTPGFYSLYINYCVAQRGSQTTDFGINLFDGATSKYVWTVGQGNSSTNEDDVVSTDRLVVYVRSGDSLRAVSFGSDGFISVSSRQIADVNGNLVNPLGFTSS